MRSPLIGVSPGFTDYGDYLGVAFGRPLEEAGATAVVLPYSTQPERILPRLDGLLLAGGRDIEPARFGGEPHPAATPYSPLRDRFELAVAPAAISAEIPVLGICRGMQIINVALGGTMELDHSLLPPPANRHPGGDWGRWDEVVAARLGGWPPPRHPSHQIAIVAGSKLAEVLGNERHRQQLPPPEHRRAGPRIGRNRAGSGRRHRGDREARRLLSVPRRAVGGAGAARQPTVFAARRGRTLQDGRADGPPRWRQPSAGRRPRAADRAAEFSCRPAQRCPQGAPLGGGQSAERPLQTEYRDELPASAQHRSGERAEVGLALSDRLRDSRSCAPSRARRPEPEDR